MTEKILSEKEYRNIQVQVPCESKTPFLSQRKAVSLIAKCRFVISLILMMVVGVGEIWGQHPFTLTTEADENNGTETLYWIESNGATGFYMIPDNSNNATIAVSTTNMPNMKALWYFMDAGTESSTQYYYIINKSTGKYLRLSGKNGSDNTIKAEAYSADNDNYFKFSIGGSEGEWILYPKSGNGSYWVNKKSGNVPYDKYLKSSNYGGSPDDNSKWIFVEKNSVTWAHPFTNSTNSEKHFYTIHNATYNGSAYYMSTDDDSDPYATISNVDDDKRIWYFMEAASDNTIPNLKYYYIVNAVTGKYLKFTGTANGTTQANSLRLYDHTGSETGNTEDRFLFMVLNAKGETYSAYSIMPKLEISYYNNKNASLSPGTSGNTYSGNNAITLSNDMKIGIYNDRGQNNNYAHWNFEPTTFNWADPVVTCNLNGEITITQVDGVNVYYTTDGNTTPTEDPNHLYSESPKPTISDGITIIQVRAIQEPKGPSNVVTKKIVYNPTITYTADSYTYIGVTQNPISSVDVSSTNIASTEYNVTYKKGGVEADFKDAGDYTIELTDVEGGEYIVYGSYDSAPISIDKADITASVSIEGWPYGESANTPSVTSNVVIEPESIVYEYKLSSADDDTYTQYVPTNAGSYLLRATIAATDNFNGVVTTSSFTISPKPLGDGTKAAEGFVITMTDNGSGGYNVSVQDGEEPLTELTDYELTKENDVVTITGIHNYTGSARLVYATATFATPDALNVPAENGYAAAYMSILDVSAPSSVTVYVVKKVNASIGTVNISKIDYIPEGVPVLMLANSDLSGFATSPIDESTTLISDAVRSNNKLQVAPDEPSDPEDANSTHGVAVKDKEAYMFYKGEFVLTQEGTIGAGKFFIYNPNYTPSSGGGSTPAPARRLQIVIEDDPTSISEDIKVNHEEYNTAGSWYTISGQRLNGKPNQKGIFIKNGQKMIIR